jgi:hypothetical protein
VGGPAEAEGARASSSVKTAAVAMHLSLVMNFV